MRFWEGYSPLRPPEGSAALSPSLEARPPLSFQIRGALALHSPVICAIHTVLLVPVPISMPPFPPQLKWLTLDVEASAVVSVVAARAVGRAVGAARAVAVAAGAAGART